MRIVAICLSLLAASAGAQDFEAGAHAGVSRLSGRAIGSLQGTPVELKDGFRFGGRMTINQFEHFGHEVGYAYNRTKWDLGSEAVGSAIHQGFYNFLAYGTPKDSRVRPFAAGGVQYTNFIYPGLSVTQGGGSNKVGVNYGGGVKVRVTSRYLIRLDVRQYLQGKPFDLPDQTGKLRLLEVSAGFSIHM